MIGIYKITNTINGHCYIGQSINIQERWRHHRSYPVSASKYPLYLAFEKYGIKNFSFEVLEECSVDQLNEKEIFYIEKYNSYYNGYNQTKGGQFGGHNIKLSQEEIEIIYDLLQNSQILQKDIASMFKVGEDTISEINQGKTRFNSKFIYPLRKKPQREKFYCIECGKEVYRGAQRCKECKSKSERRVERPSREELKTLIRSTPFTQIGSLYGVSDNTIRKWCLAVNLPSKSTEIKKITDNDWIKI